MDSKELDRLKGMFFGLAVGDALGTPLEFKDRDTYEHLTGMVGGGPFRLQPGEWTDDTSMALALGQTFIDHGYGPDFKIELLKNFTRWYRNGEFSHNGRCFDIGTTTSQAIRTFIISRGTNDSPASEDPFASGNGGIMRLAPAVVLAMAPPTPNAHLDHVRSVAMIQSETTHASDDCMKIARTMASNLAELVLGTSYSYIRRKSGVPMPRTRDAVKSTGYVVDTWQAANWAVANTDNFKDALLLAVNLGDDADTVGAVTGQLAGAVYGYDAIPTEWLDVLAWNDKLERMFYELTYIRDE
jgi:ADP-ribosyl-[dinitrogen reductase] hydrolase